MKIPSSPLLATQAPSAAAKTRGTNGRCMTSSMKIVSRRLVGTQNSSQLGDRDLGGLTRRPPRGRRRTAGCHRCASCRPARRASTSSVSQGSRSAGRPLAAQRPAVTSELELAARPEDRSRHPARRDQAEPDRLAVEEARRRRLDRVADGVAEVEERAVAGLLALVAADDRRLVGDRARRSPRAARPGSGLAAAAAHDARMRRPLATGRGRRAARTSTARRTRRGARAAGSVESVARLHATSRGCQNAPTQVLARRQIDRGLAADRGVGHRDDRRRQLHDRDAAEQASRRRTRRDRRRRRRRARRSPSRDRARARPARSQIRSYWRERLARLAGLDLDRLVDRAAPSSAPRRCDR